MAFVFDNVKFRKLLRTQPWDAYEFLYKHYRVPLLYVALRFTRDKHAARDMVQDTFAEIWDIRNTLLKVHEKSFDNYLARIVQYKSIDYYKLNIRHEDIDVVMLYQEFASEENTLESIITKELYRDFRKFIQGLPPRQKECLTMKIDRLMSLDEIAAELDISRKTVELSQGIAVKKLTKWAKGYR